jgi:hypothetical protein
MLEILGILTIGVLFIPLAATCAIVGLLRGISAGNAAGIGASLLGGALSVVGLIVSPSLWLLLALMFIPKHLAAPTNPPVTPTATLHTELSEQQFVGGLNQAVIRMKSLIPQADIYNKQLLDLGQNFQTVTHKMDDYAGHQRDLANSADGPAKRSKLMPSMNEIIRSMNQELLETNHLRNDADKVRIDFSTRVGPLWKAVGTMHQRCTEMDQSPLPKSNLKDQVSACSNFKTVYSDFQQQYRLLSEAFANLEITYHRELKSQQELLQEAVRLERN